MAIWQKGQSGNPKGRPPKVRALTAILETALSKKVARSIGDGQAVSIPAKQALAAMIVEAATSGQVTFSDGKTMQVAEGEDWFAIVKFIYSHIDGPPRLDVDVTSDGQALTFLALVQAAQEPTA